MRTNLDKWNYYQSIIDTREQDYVKQQVTEIPKSFFYVNPSGSIGEKIISHVKYFNGKNLSFNKVPTKINVEIIKSFSENNEPLSLDKIYLHYYENNSFGKSSGAIKFTDINKHLSKEEAEKKSLEIKEKNNQEELLLQNGHSRCERCRKVVPTPEIQTVKIISFATYGQAGRIGKFCSGICSAHEQMSLEG